MAYVRPAWLVGLLVFAACSFDSQGFQFPADDGGGTGGATAGGGSGGQGGQAGQGGQTGGSGGQGGGGGQGRGGSGVDAAADRPRDAGMDVSTTRAGLGEACTSSSACESGACVDGVCCENACPGLCRACVTSKTGQPNGRCRPVSGATDPDNECAPEPASTCGRIGSCDGNGACALHANGTVCIAAKCVGSTFTPSGRCNGMNTCVVPAARPCEFGLACANATSCRTSCSGQSDCMGGDYCDPTDGRCRDKKALGAACVSGLAGADCLSGACVDGVCCENGCSGTCMACSSSKTGQSNGKCAAVSAGADPDNECGREDASTCGRDGSCDGAGACRKYADGTACANRCCTTGAGVPYRCGAICAGGSCKTEPSMVVQSCDDDVGCTEDKCEESNGVTRCTNKSTCGGCCCSTFKVCTGVGVCNALEGMCLP